MQTGAPLAFFSHSRQDAEFVLKLATDLKLAGAAVWLDQLDIAPGQRWDKAIEQALADCPNLLVVLSPASVESNNVMDEVSFALEENRVVIPVFYQDCKIPFRLRRLQYIDFRTNYEKGLRDLLALLGVPGSTAEKKQREQKEQQEAEAPRAAAEKGTQERIAQEQAEARRRHQEELARQQAAERIRQKQVAQQEPRDTEKKSPTKLYVGLGIAAALAVIFGIAISNGPPRNAGGGVVSSYVPAKSEVTSYQSPHTEEKSPAPPQTPPEFQTQPEVDAQWLQGFIEAGQGPPASRVRPYYDDVVSPYFAMPRARWSEIENDKDAYFQRFPSIHYTLVGTPSLHSLADGGRQLEFDLEYSATRADGRTMTGRAHQLAYLRLSGGQWKITGIIERKVH